jgi:hypothetical protein
VADDLGAVDLTDLGTFVDGFPHDAFRLHREVAPVWWHEATAHTSDGEGFWSVACYDEVLRVLNDPVTFSSVLMASGSATSTRRAQGKGR